MIAYPTSRIWLYPAPDGALEIVLLGDDEAVAALYAAIRALAEGWRGFDRVAALAQSGAVLGVRVTLSPTARHRAPVREALHAMRTSAPDLYQRIEWDVLDLDGVDAGAIGTW